MEKPSKIHEYTYHEDTHLHVEKEKQKKWFLSLQISLLFSYIFLWQLHTYFSKWNFHNTFTIQSKTPPQFSLTIRKKRKNWYYVEKGRKKFHNKRIYLCCTLIFTCLCACCFFEFHSCISFQKKALVEKRKVWLKSFV